MCFPIINMVRTVQNITLLRTQRGLSVRQLQKLLGFATPQSIYKWPNGTSLPTIDNMVALSCILHVSIEKILVMDDAS